MQPLGRKRAGDHPDKLLYWQTWMAGGRAAVGDLEEHLLPPTQILAKAVPWLGSLRIMSMPTGCF